MIGFWLTTVRHLVSFVALQHGTKIQYLNMCSKPDLVWYIVYIVQCISYNIIHAGNAFRAKLCLKTTAVLKSMLGR